MLALDYALGSLFEPRFPAPPDGKPLARIWLFAQCTPLDQAGFSDWLEAELADGRHAGDAVLGEVSPAIDAERYAADVERIRRYIAEGDCYQVNYTFPLHFRWSGSALRLYARLREGQPVRYGGFIGGAGEGILSLSPELFVERAAGGRVFTRPMKGTASRSRPASWLAESEKDRAENLMIVDLLRNDLGRLAPPGGVRVEQLFAVEPYPTVWQMTSEISAEIGKAGLNEVLAALFPCGSITGAPKIRAAQIIDELEASPRGLYTGSLGWLAPDGAFRLNVAIRTLALAADGSGRMGIGSGIVTDSSAADEWAECLLKARFLAAANQGLRLIETLRCVAGDYPLLEGHLARLSRSAAWLGFPCDLAAVRAALAACPPAGEWRVRLLLGSDGHLEAGFFPLEASPARYRVRLAGEAIDPDNPLRRHKTTARATYDAALAALPAESGIFDLIFLNTRGEVAEGARSNVFVEREGCLLTPPLTSGALPGVLRASLLASGRAREAVLWPADLADGFFIGNALRGLVPADWADSA